MRRLAFFVLFPSFILCSVMGLVCGRVPCNPSNPDYDPITGTCPATPPGGDGTLGPAGPGTGELPTEPGTEDPPSAGDNVDPGSVNTSVFGLDGVWVDNGREACISQSGTSVTASYLDAYVCHEDNPNDPNDTTDTTYTDFEGTLQGTTITGLTSTCRFGHDSGNGIVSATMTLNVSADGKTLSGTWHNNDTGEEVDFSLTRETVGKCQ
jgi:hypothetical protein